MGEWYYTRDGLRLGPVTWEALRQMADAGRLGPQDQVWTDGWTEWFDAAQVDGLMPSPPADVTPPDVDPGEDDALRQLQYAVPAHARHYTLLDRPGKHDGLATAAMRLACISFLFGAFLVGIPALVCGWVALHRMNRSQDWVGQGKAIAGVVIGALWVVVLIVLVVLVWATADA